MNTNASNVHNPATPDDPTLTAYVLGELDGDQALSITARLADDDDLRREVEAIRAAADALRDGFAAEPAHALTPAQRSRIMAAQDQPMLRLARDDRRAAAAAAHTPMVFVARSRWIGSGLAAAALIAITITAAMMYVRDRERSPVELAIRDRPSDTALSADDAASVHAAGPVSHAAAEALGFDRSSETQKAPAQTESLAARIPTGSDGDMLSLGVEASPPPAQMPGASRMRSTPDAPTTGALAPTSAPHDLQPGVAPPLPALVSRPSTLASTPAVPAARSSTPAAAPSAQPAVAPERTDTAVVEPQGQPAGVSVQDKEQAQGGGGGAAGGRGGLRDPARREVSADNGAAEPTLTASQVDALTAVEVRRELDRIRRERESRQVDARREAVLRQQQRLLDARLRTIERVEAEAYSRMNDNPFVLPRGFGALSSLPLQVIPADLESMLSELAAGRLPAPDRLTFEGLIHAVGFSGPSQPSAAGASVFTVGFELAPAPWNPAHQLVQIIIRAADMPAESDQHAPVIVARDARIEVEFNPAVVGAYRLIGFDGVGRPMSSQQVRAATGADVPAGTHVVALYELAPIGTVISAQTGDLDRALASDMEYQQPGDGDVRLVPSDNLLTVRVGYRPPAADSPLQVLRFPFKRPAPGEAMTMPSSGFRLTAAVAEFAMLMRRSPHAAGGTLEHVLTEAEGVIGHAPDDPRRARFLELVRLAMALENQ